MARFSTLGSLQFVEVSAVTDSEIEAAIDGCGPGRLALIESAFRDDILWNNMARHCGIDAGLALLVRPYILANFDPDGTWWRAPTDR